jgi:uncharacterized protein
MKIDVADFMKNKLAKKEFHLSLEMDNFNYGNEEIKVLKPVDFNGIIFMTGDILNLEAHIVTDLELICSRCLQPFLYAYDVNLNEKFTLNSDNKDDDVIFMDSDSLNITEIIENNIIMSLPIKHLCSESCKGLCQICGTNLNLSTCNCERKDFDPRLAKLKDMFSTD